jgi:ATP-dependent DNA ligase
MRKVAFKPCIPTRGTQVPAGPDWFHEIKHDGYRLMARRVDLALFGQLGSCARAGYGPKL